MDGLIDPAACPVPVDRPVMVHWWQQLTFIHWSFPPEAVQRLLPPGLEVQPVDGVAWVGLVPFFMRVGLPRVRPVRWLSCFPETNVRTYVRDANGEQGIWFFSLDAARLGAVITARATYRLPYFWSSMRVGRQGDTMTYECRRRWPGSTGARSRAVVEIAERYATAQLTPLDHFLTARWTLYSAPRRGLHLARAAHPPWPLQRGRLLEIHDDLLPAAGLPPPTGTPLVHYAESVKVQIGRPERLSV